MTAASAILKEHIMAAARSFSLAASGAAAVGRCRPRRARRGLIAGFSALLQQKERSLRLDRLAFRMKGCPGGWAARQNRGGATAALVAFTC
jgi:hypothetical protein